jgi:hypothetical protein
MSGRPDADDCGPDAMSAAQAWWRGKAAELSAELGFEILYCPLGFEVPRRDGGITHVSSPDAVRTVLGGSW